MQFERKFDDRSGLVRLSGNSIAANNGLTISAAPPLPWYKNSCITSALGAGALNPFSPSLSSAGEGTAAVLAASQYNAAVQYAASAPNYLGGTGLIYPMKSSVVRSM